MDRRQEILCIGSALWDTIGRCDHAMTAGNDRPGRIRRLPGGVALNIAMTFVRLGLVPRVLTVLGTDREGDALAGACAELGVDLSLALRDPDLPTDAYMAVEGANGLIAAIADAHSLEAAGAAILSPLEDGRLGTPEAPYGGAIALDGNLTASLLEEIALSRLFARADLRVVPASPGKALRLLPFLSHGRGTLYVHLEEANLLTGMEAHTARDAARALVASGACRAMVTHGAEGVADCCRAELHTATPPAVAERRVTGAGDTFMAAHVAAELAGMPRAEALTRAAQAAARYVSGEDA